jgi:BirA family biotin operon repressor/biotin-[acetyl-CoA-carboxylase] ligase
MSRTPPVDDRELEQRLARETRFSRVVHVAACDSTQDLAQQLDAPGSVIVWADEQRAGRGRNDRSWSGEPGQDVEMTMRVERLVLEHPARLAAAAPAAFLRGLERLSGLRLTMKWPNDLCSNGRKLCGVLIDVLGGSDEAYLIGVGVNVNRTTFPPELRETATSLAILTGIEFDRRAVVAELVESLDDCISTLERDDDDPSLATLFSDRLGLAGRTVHLAGPDLDIEARLAAIDFDHATLADGRRIALARVNRLAGA